MRIGYTLSCEEFGPHELLEQARMAEQAGFQGLWVSDHYHPWLDEQGHSPFVWSLVGGLSQVSTLPVTTAVTCPTVRIHPAIVAQAAATSAVLHAGRFVLGVGSGEALNEHILGGPWPDARVRLAMLEEAVEVMRKLWAGGFVDHRGEHYTVENARIYTLPDSRPRVYVSGFGPRSVDLAARIGDGYVSTRPDPKLVSRFRDHGGDGKPAQSYALGPDPQRQLTMIEQYAKAGYDEVYVANIGPYQREFFDMYARDVLPALPSAESHRQR